MRDYLFVELALKNACRPESIVNMFMSEYEKVEFEEDGTAVIYVKKHKTASTHGHVGVFFKPIVYKFVTTKSTSRCRFIICFFNLFRSTDATRNCK